MKASNSLIQALHTLISPTEDIDYICYLLLYVDVEANDLKWLATHSKQINSSFIVYRHILS